MKVFLLIFGALVLLLLCPVHLQLHWKEEPSATARWLFLRFPLLPPPQPKKDKQNKASAPADQAQPAKKSAQPSPVDTLTQYADLLPEILGRLKGFAAFILRHTKVKKLQLDMLVAKEDVAETAIAFGRVNQAVYTALAPLQNMLRFGCKPRINIAFDYLGQKEEAEVWLTASLAPLFALLGAIGFAAGLVWALFTRQKTQKTA